MQDPAPDEPVAAPPVAGGPRWAVIGIFLLLAVAGLAYARAFPDRTGRPRPPGRLTRRLSLSGRARTG
jgi:hypothetical protein